MEVKFQLFRVLPQLENIVERIWYFETPGRLPESDLKLVVPDGKPLMLLVVKNGLESTMNNGVHIAPKNKISIIGTSDNPSFIDSSTDDATAAIGVDFSPIGFYKLFHFPAAELTNTLYSLSGVLSGNVNELENRISAVDDLAQKVQMLQQFLLAQSNSKQEDMLFEYCVKELKQRHGNILISQLEKLTGYSSRWLNKRFYEQLGMSPKQFASIMRFQFYYKVITGITPKSDQNKISCNPYYDESHFIKDFKRYTGTTPSRLVDIENRFGRLFY